MNKVKNEHAIIRASGIYITSGSILAGLLPECGSWLLVDSLTSAFFSLQMLHCFLVLEYVLPAVASCCNLKALGKKQYILLLWLPSSAF